MLPTVEVRIMRREILVIAFQRCRRSAVVLAVLVVALFTLLPSATSQAGVGSVASRALVTRAEAVRGTEQPGAAAGLAVERLARILMSATFEAVVLQPDGLSIMVYETVRDEAAENALRRAAGTSPLSFSVVPNSEVQLRALQDKVTADAGPVLHSAGIDLAAWGPEPTTGLLMVRVIDLTDAKAAVLHQRYGTASLHIYSIVRADAPHAADRIHDSAPYNGGDFITDGVTGDCSSGFGVHAGSQMYMLTAAHCFPVNGAIANASITQSFGGAGLIGTVTAQDLAYGGNDVELISSPALIGTSGLIYTGSESAPQRAAVSGTVDSPAGYQVCQSGAFEGEICAITVQYPSICINESDGAGTVRYTCNIAQAATTDGSIAVGNGDSGGPVFRFQGSLLEATGTVTAEAGGGPLCPTVNALQTQIRD